MSNKIMAKLTIATTALEKKKPKIPVDQDLIIYLYLSYHHESQ